MMIGLALALGANNGRPRQSPENVLCQAIAAKVRVIATHKGKTITLEPYGVFSDKNDALMLAAVDVDHKGSRGKLDHFALAYLAEISATSETFVAGAKFDPSKPPYRDRLVCSI